MKKPNKVIEAPRDDQSESRAMKRKIVASSWREGKSSRGKVQEEVNLCKPSGIVEGGVELEAECQS